MQSLTHAVPFQTVDCGVLPPLENGTITYSPGTAVGGVATHSCDEGFIVQGGTERVCQMNGLWEPLIIFCLKGTYVCLLLSNWKDLCAVMHVNTTAIFKQSNF